MQIKSLITLLTLVILVCIFCSRNPVDPPEGEPTKFYMCDQNKLSAQPGPSDGWIYITRYIYPTQLTQANWTRFLTKNISGFTYSYDLVVWSQQDCRLKLEFLLSKDGEEVLASEELDVPYIADDIGIHLKNEIEGKNPLGGKGKNLTLRITHLSGTVPIEIFFDAAPGYLGHSYITVPLID